MEKQLSAHQFESVYEDLGYDLSKLGCIMIDIVPDDLENRVLDIVEPIDLYTAQDPSHRHINGIVAAEPHVTLLYGLLRTGTEMKKHVLQVLDAGKSLPKTVEVEEIGYFESHIEAEPYYCIVAHLKVTPELHEANERLKFLPHINTFPEYRAHMTLAYIRKDDDLRDGVVAYLNTTLRDRVFITGEINFGDL